MVVTATDAYTGLPVRAPGAAGSGAMSGISQRKKLPSGQPNPVPRPYGRAGDPNRKPSYIDTDAGKHLPFARSTGIRDPYAAGGFGSYGYEPLPTQNLIERSQQEGIAATQRDPVTGLLLTAPGGVQGGSSSEISPVATQADMNVPSWMRDRDSADPYYDGSNLGETFDPSEVTTNSLGQLVEKDTGVVIDPAQVVVEEDDLVNNEIYEETKIEDVEAPPVPGFAESVTSQFEEFRLSGSIDTQRLHEWQLTLLGQQLYITDVREVPPNSGQFIATDSDGVEHSSGPMLTSDTDVLTGEIAIQRVENETARLALDDEMQREQLRIQEELGRIDQDIARDRIRHEQEVASGNWQNALNVQDRIDERERAGRQLDRDLFNASQELQNRKFELERASFDLDKMEFFQQLSSSPANFADLFNISRGLAPTGAGGPMPQGVSRIGQSNVQQTAAQDFRMNGINMAPNINTGALPTLGAEQAVPQFNPAQAQLSFMNGQDPSPVDATGQPVVPAAAPPQLNTEPSGETDAYAETGSGIVQDAIPYAEEGAGIPQDQFPAPLDFNATTDESGANISAPVNTSVTDGLETISAPGAVVAQTAEDVVQGAPLPPGIEMAFRNALVGAPQIAQNSIPLLSPQVINSLTPAEREVYYGLAQMQGQYLPDFQNQLASRGGSQQIQDSQRIFA